MLPSVRANPRTSQAARDRSARLPGFATSTVLAKMSANFPLETADTLVIDVCKNMSHLNVYIGGGWVRDKLLGLKAKDIDLMVLHDDFDEFATNLEDALVAKAKELKMSVSQWEESPLGTDLICGKTLHLFQFKLTNTTTGETTDMEIDAKQLYPGWDYNKDMETRDFSVNALYYCPRTGKVIGREQDFKDLKAKVLKPTISIFQTAEDTVRLLRAFRLKYEKEGFQFSPEWDAYLRGEGVDRFSGWKWPDPPKHSNKVTPLEYKKIINQPKIFIPCMTEIYEYGYIFRWRRSVRATQISVLLKAGLEEHLASTAGPLTKWSQGVACNEPGFWTNTLLLSLAICLFEGTSSISEFCEKTKSQNLFTTFFPEADRPAAKQCLSKLAEDYKQGVAELSALKQFQEAFTKLASTLEQ